MSDINFKLLVGKFSAVCPLFLCLGMKCSCYYLSSVYHFQYFLGALAKLRKATVSFVISVCPSVRTSDCMEQLGSHRMDFHKT